MSEHSTEQNQYLQWLSGVGYLANVANGFDDAKEIIENYLGIVE